jgi:hypothetical protein
VPIVTRQKLSSRSLFLKELIRKYMMGKLQETDVYPQFMYRATVLAVDPDGGALENPNAEGSFDAVIDGQQTKLKASSGPSNPPNSLKCRIITDGRDRLNVDSDVGVFWPLMPEHMAPPVKPGEHVYVVFEDQHRVHGLWLGRVSGHVGANVVIGASQLKPSSGGINDVFDGASEETMTDAAASGRPKSSDDLNSKLDGIDGVDDV